MKEEVSEVKVDQEKKDKVPGKPPKLLKSEFENSADGKVQYIYEVIREFADTSDMSREMRLVQIKTPAIDDRDIQLP